MILEIDWQGAAQVRKHEAKSLFFILPPTRQLRERPSPTRQQDDAAIIDARMAEADETIAQAPHFDYWVINDHLKSRLSNFNQLF